MPRSRDRNGRQGHLPTTPLPFKKVVILGLILAINNWSIWMIFSFLPYLTAHLSSNLSFVELGYRAGYLGAAFSGGSIFGNIFWGVLADKYGRRIALLNGLIGTLIAAILFGFSPTFSAAVTLRFLWGILNGNIGVSKTYIGEILDDTNTPEGMALYGVFGGSGRFIGFLVGGFLVSPANRFSVFKDTLLDKFPFALPSAAVAISCAIIFLFAYFELQETLKIRLKRSPTEKRKKSENKNRRILRRGNAMYSEVSSSDFDLDLEIDADDAVVDVESSDGKPDTQSSSYYALRPVQHTAQSRVMKPVTATKKSLALALPLISLRTDVINKCDSNISGLSTPTTARIEESLPPHFRINPSIDTPNGNHLPDADKMSLDDCCRSVVMRHTDVDEYDDLFRADSPPRNKIFGVDYDASHRGNGTELNGDRHMEGIRHDIGDIGVDRISLDFNKCTEGCGKRPTRDTENRDVDKMRKNDWDSRPSDVLRERDRDKDSDDIEMPSTQQSSRRVSFSSLVMVKVIGSSSLGIGQLKHLRPDDHPVSNPNSSRDDRLDVIENVMGPESRLSLHIDVADSVDRPTSNTRDTNTHTRYSNGSEFNNSLAARHGTLLQRVRYLLSKKQILVTTFMYGANGLVQLLFTEMISLWLVAPLKSGGFSFNTYDIGTAILIAAASTVLLQLSVYPVLVESHGVLFTYRLGCALFALTLFALPILFLVKENNISAQAVWVSITLALTAAGTSTMFTLVSIFILVNNSCYSHERATVNGIGQVFVSLARLCAPFIVSQMVAQSGNKRRTDWLVYYTLLGAATLINSRLALLLPRSIERRRREPMEPRYAHSTAEDYDEDCSELEDLIPGGGMPSPPQVSSPRIENSHSHRDREREREKDKPNGVVVGTSSTI